MNRIRQTRGEPPAFDLPHPTMASPELPIKPDQPWLAPLAGYTDLPFRLLCREFGAAAACTEMISAKGLVYQSPGTTRLGRTCPEDAPLVVQLFGSEPDTLRQALEMLMGMGHTFFDLNAGCPVRKVVKTGAGAALLQNPEVLARIVQKMVKVSGEGRLGVKIRAGWDRHSPGPVELAQRLEGSGAAWVTLHPRTARQGFSGRADWTLLRDVRERIVVPLLGSGDLFTAADGMRCLTQTGISGVMFARGAMANPGVFDQLRSLVHACRSLHDQEISGEHTPDEGSDSARHRPGRADCGRNGHILDSGGPETLSSLVSMAQRHIELCQAHEQEGKAFLRMRTVLPRYFRGFAGARTLRSRIVDCRTWEELLHLVAGLPESIAEQVARKPD